MKAALLQVRLAPRSLARNVQAILSAIDRAGHVDPPPDLLVLPGACDSGGAAPGRGFPRAGIEAIKEAMLPLLEEDACRAFVLFPYWTDVGSVLTGQRGVGHACEVETSLALHLFRELVKSDAIEDPTERGSISRSDPYMAGVAQGPPAFDWKGGSGKPSEATAEKGAAILDLCLAPMVEFVKGKLGAG